MHSSHQMICRRVERRGIIVAGLLDIGAVLVKQEACEVTGRSAVVVGLVDLGALREQASREVEVAQLDAT